MPKRSTSAVLCLILAATGCAPRALFRPAELIHRDNLERLTTVYRAKLGSFAAHHLLHGGLSYFVERPTLLADGAVDGERRLLYFRKETGDFGSGRGIHVVELDTGRVRQMPAGWGVYLTGGASRVSAGTFFDVSHETVYIETILTMRNALAGTDPGGQAGPVPLREYGRPRALVRTTPDHSRARLIAYNALLPQNAAVSDEQFLVLLEEGLGSAVRVGLADRRDGRILRSLLMPEVNRETDELRVAGGVGQTVLAIHRHKESVREARLLALHPDGKELRVAAEVDCGDEYPIGLLVDLPTSRAFLFVQIGAERYGVRAFDAATLRPLFRTEDVPHVHLTALIPGTTILAYVPDKPNRLALVDLESGETLRELTLQPFGSHDHFWRAISDPTCRYIGAMSERGVHLFAASPNRAARDEPGYLRNTIQRLEASIYFAVDVRTTVTRKASYGTSTIVLDGDVRWRSDGQVLATTRSSRFELNGKPVRNGPDIRIGSALYDTAATWLLPEGADTPKECAQSDRMEAIAGEHDVQLAGMLMLALSTRERPFSRLIDAVTAAPAGSLAGDTGSKVTGFSMTLGDESKLRIDLSNDGLIQSICREATPPVKRVINDVEVESGGAPEVLETFTNWRIQTASQPGSSPFTVEDLTASRRPTGVGG